MNILKDFLSSILLALYCVIAIVLSATAYYSLREYGAAVPIRWAGAVGVIVVFGVIYVFFPGRMGKS